MVEFRLKSGRSIPAIGLGTWNLRGDLCVDSVCRALELGYRHIDTATAYDNHRQVGIGIRNSGASREDIFITSKVWYDSLHYNDLVSACNRALGELGVDYVDLYLIHWPNKDVPMEESFRALERLVEDGAVRDIGVSNFTIAHISEALRVSRLPICVNQVEYHVYLNQEALRSECERHGIRLTAYAPLARGAILDNPVLIEIAARHGRSTAQVALRWLLQKGIVVIPKASSAEHLKANLAVCGFELSTADMRQIDGIGVERRFIKPRF